MEDFDAVRCIIAFGFRSVKRKCFAKTKRIGFLVPMGIIFSTPIPGISARFNQIPKCSYKDDERPGQTLPGQQQHQAAASEMSKVFASVSYEHTAASRPGLQAEY